MKNIDKCGIAKSFKVQLKNHLKELVESREYYIKNNNKEIVERYDKWIDSTLDNINLMDRVINTETKNKQQIA